MDDKGTEVQWMGRVTKVAIVNMETEIFNMVTDVVHGREHPIDTPAVEVEMEVAKQGTREYVTQPSGVDDPEHGSNSSRKKRIDYYKKGVVRSFMLCGTEKVTCERSTELIERQVVGSGSVRFGDPNGTECEDKITESD